MRPFVFCLLLAVACSTTRPPLYAPGGGSLPPAARKLYQAARQAERNGEQERAARLYTDLCSAWPLRLGFHLARLRHACRWQGPAAAAALYNPPPPGVGADRADLLSHLAALPEDDLAQRRTFLDFATAQEPREALWRLAVADLELRSHDTVIARAKRQRDLGAVVESQASYDEAEVILERARQEAETALQLDAGLAESQLLLGYISTRMADIQRTVEKREEWRREADSHYHAALEIDPESIEARINLAENAFYFDEYDVAFRELKTATELAPRDPRAWSSLGAACYRMGRIGEAKGAYAEALAIEPANARVRAALADCLWRSGDMDEAIAELEKARTDAGEDRALIADIAFHLAAIHEQNGRLDLAIGEYRRHIELGGRDSAKAQSRITRLYESDRRR